MKRILPQDAGLKFARTEKVKIKKSAIKKALNPKKKLKKLENECTALWREIVLKRDEYRCQWLPCRTSGNNKNPLQAHHIFSKRSWAVKWYVHNGITLCKNHHFYYPHGRGVMQFNDFIRDNFLGEKLYFAIKMKVKNKFPHSISALEIMKIKLEQEL